MIRCSNIGWYQLSIMHILQTLTARVVLHGCTSFCCEIINLTIELFEYSNTGSKEGSQSDGGWPDIWVLCCLQFNWFFSTGEICKYTLPHVSVIRVWCEIYCSGLTDGHFLLQIVQIGAKFMLIAGLFVSSGCTIMFG